MSHNWTTHEPWYDPGPGPRARVAASVQKARESAQQAIAALRAKPDLEPEPEPPPPNLSAELAAISARTGIPRIIGKDWAEIWQGAGQYGQARNMWVNYGRPEDKQLMLDTVTLTYPADTIPPYKPRAAEPQRISYPKAMIMSMSLHPAPYVLLWLLVFAGLVCAGVFA